jgi:hypothetical protein
MYKFSLLFALVCMVLSKGYGQRSHAEPSEFQKIFNRTLLVEVLEEEPRILKHLEKSLKKHPGAIEDYKGFIKLYNEKIQLAVNKFWTLNEQIEFWPTSRIDSLVKAHNDEYTCLYYSESAEQFVDYMTGHNLVVPTLNYTRIEHHNKKVDYSIYLPVSFLLPHDEYIETDLIFGVQFMQRNIEYMMEKNKKISATAYAKMFGASCTLLETKMLLLDNGLLSDSVSMHEIKDNYKYKFSFVPASKINEAVEHTGEEYAYLVSMPYELASAGGPGAAKQIVCMRLIIDAKNGNILSSIGTAVQENNTKIFLTKDFATCETCK